MDFQEMKHSAIRATVEYVKHHKNFNGLGNPIPLTCVECEDYEHCYNIGIRFQKTKEIHIFEAFEFELETDCWDIRWISKQDAHLGTGIIEPSELKIIFAQGKELSKWGKNHLKLLIASDYVS